jgi:hypothetical protein
MGINYAHILVDVLDLAYAHARTMPQIRNKYALLYGKNPYDNQSIMEAAFIEVFCKLPKSERYLAANSGEPEMGELIPAGTDLPEAICAYIHVNNVELYAGANHVKSKRGSFSSALSAYVASIQKVIRDNKKTMEGITLDKLALPDHPFTQHILSAYREQISPGIAEFNRCFGQVCEPDFSRWAADSTYQGAASSKGVGI